MFSYILNWIGETFGEERPPETISDDIDFNPGFCLDIGITWAQLLKKLLIPKYARASEIKRGCPSHCRNVKLRSCGRNCDCNLMAVRSKS